MRASITKEILAYFKFCPSLDGEKLRIERAALLTACKAWRAWKHKMVTEFVNVETTPYVKFPVIKSDDWSKFVTTKTSDEFKNTSKAKRELAMLYSCPHKMGTAGYSAMSKIWDKEDEQAIAEGRMPVLSDIKDPRARRWARARISSYDEVTGEPIFADKLAPILKRVVRDPCPYLFQSLSYKHCYLTLMNVPFNGLSRWIKIRIIRKEPSREMCSQRGWETLSTVVAPGE